MTPTAARAPTSDAPPSPRTPATARAAAGWHQQSTKNHRQTAVSESHECIWRHVLHRFRRGGGLPDRRAARASRPTHSDFRRRRRCPCRCRPLPGFRVSTTICSDLADRGGSRRGPWPPFRVGAVAPRPAWWRILGAWRWFAPPRRRGDARSRRWRTRRLLHHLHAVDATVH